MRKILISRRNLFAVLVCAATLGLATPAANGGTIVVRANGTGDYPTIQDAIDAAVAGDEVVLEAGTYTGDGNRDIDFKGKAIMVRSIDANSVATTIIDCNSSEFEQHRGFYFRRGEDETSVLKGLTITNGCASRGGGIFCENSSPTIVNNIITKNSVLDFAGAAICSQGGRPRILYNTISYNVIGCFDPYSTSAVSIYANTSDKIEIKGNTFINDGVELYGRLLNVVISANIFRDFTGEARIFALRAGGTSNNAITVTVSARG